MAVMFMSGSEKKSKKFSTIVLNIGHDAAEFSKRNVKYSATLVVYSIK